MAEFNLSSLAIPIGLSRRGFVCSLNQPPKGRFLQAKQVHIRTSSDFKQFFLEIFTGNKVCKSKFTHEVNF
jgi:hypothetical protein